MSSKMRSILLSYVPATIAQRIQFLVKEPSRRREVSWVDNPQMNGVLKDLRQEGFAVIPDYLAPQHCVQGIAEFDSALGSYPNFIHRSVDERLFGIEQASSVARRLFDDADLQTLARAYSGEECAPLFILANRVRPDRTQPFGSGGGWHRDGFGREIKLIVYLKDVGPQNGPFQILRKSHSSSAILADIAAAKLSAAQNRVDEAANILIKRNPSRLFSFEGSAGTAIIFDTSSIHRGAPIQHGVRDAFTVYMTALRNHKEGVFSHFAPVLGVGTVQ